MKEKPQNCRIDNYAIIDENVEIGCGTKIFQFARIHSNVIIGGNCSIGQYVIIERNVKIGNNVKIEDDARIEENVKIAMSSADEQNLDDEEIFSIKDPYTGFSKKQKYKTLIKEGAVIRSDSEIQAGTIIGRYSYVEMESEVCSNVPDNAFVHGSPAVIKHWISETGRKLKFNEKGIAYCPKSEKTYLLKNDVVTEVVK